MRNKCHGHGSYNVWEELGADNAHAYRLTCSICGKFSRWGTEAALKRAMQSVEVTKFIPHRPRVILPAWLTDEDC
jgi:hypothetical protein